MYRRVCGLAFALLGCAGANNLSSLTKNDICSAQVFLDGEPTIDEPYHVYTASNILKEYNFQTGSSGCLIDITVQRFVDPVNDPDLAAGDLKYKVTTLFEAKLKVKQATLAVGDRKLNLGSDVVIWSTQDVSVNTIAAEDRGIGYELVIGKVADRLNAVFSEFLNDWNKSH